jgi:hypothetical protein
MLEAAQHFAPERRGIAPNAADRAAPDQHAWATAVSSTSRLSPSERPVAPVS